MKFDIAITAIAGLMADPMKELRSEGAAGPPKADQRCHAPAHLSRGLRIRHGRRQVTFCGFHPPPIVRGRVLAGRAAPRPTQLSNSAAQVSPAECAS